MHIIELTAEEKALVAKSERHDPAYWKAVGQASLQLMKLLTARKAIPEVRAKYFTDPEFNIGGRGRSRAERFERKGTHGEAVFRHVHFLRYLHYFLYGPALPGGN